MKAVYNITCAVAILAAGVSIIALASGCQSPGKVLSVETSDVCPTCKMQTVTSPIRGLTYTKCVCPSCRTETTLDPEQEDVLRRYVGLGSDVPTVHVCDRCKTMVEKCSVCRKESAGK
jgi:hypothetical protein